MKGRVLSLSTVDFGGGAERMARCLHEGFRGRGWDSTLLVGRKQGDDEDTVEMHASPHFDYRTVARHPAVRFGSVHRAWDRWRGKEAFHYPYSNWLTSIAGGREPDAILAHNLHGGYFDLRVLSGLSNSYPVFWFLHDLWPLTGHCAFPVDCDRWRSGCGRCPDLRLPPAISRDHTCANLRIKKGIYRDSRLHLVVPCEWLAEQVRQSVLGDLSAEVSVIPYGIDLDRFHPPTGSGERGKGKFGEEEPETLGVFLANNPVENAYKNFAVLEGATARLEERRRKSGAPESPVRRLRLLAVGAPRDEVVFEGENVTLELRRWTGSEEIPEILRRADFLVHPARAEITPVAVHEAMACGVPVIASDVGGLSEMLTPGEEGLLVADGDPGAWADAIGEAAANPAEWKERGRRARLREESLGGIERMLGEVEDLVGKVNTEH